MSYENKNISELKEICKNKGLSGYSKLRKDELINLLRGGNKSSKNIFNKFFKKIFVISLYDKTERWEKVAKQFKSRKIEVERFIAIDGRCKNEGTVACEQKRKSFEIQYNVKLPLSKKYPLKELIPASSLSIGTVVLLRQMVKEGWPTMLICEDDVVLGRNLLNKFEQGIKELNKTQKDWDILYLGCGNKCGNANIGTNKSKKHKNISPLTQFIDAEFFVQYPDDLRMICEDCPKISDNLSRPLQPGGTWCYAYSLKGAKKFLKFVDNDVSEHIDQLLKQAVTANKLKAVSFDPPIVWHEGGAFRSDTDIPWEW